ncbi:MAG: hypothetical protein KGJ80_10715 [Chloroflexota bacterium]|nr:hypothetical protein [Chloroflexota bacterium]
MNNLTLDHSKETERFWEKEIRELYLVESGIKADLELSSIYAEFGGLFSSEAVQHLLASTDGSSKERHYLAEFAALRYLRESVHELDREINQVSHAAIVLWEGREVTLPALPARIAKETDRPRRHELERRRLALVAQLNPWRARRWQVLHTRVKELGFPDYTTFCDQVRGLNLESARRQADFILQATRETWLTLLHSELSAIDLTVEEAESCDLAFLLRAPQFDSLFPKEHLLSTLDATLSGMGIERAKQKELQLDIEPRPLKSPRPFCASIRVPQEIKLVINPRGGQSDYRALFHEAGHAQHSLHTDARHPFAFRCLGDDSVSEGYAFLFENLIQDSAWHTRILGMPAPANYLRFASFVRLHQARRIAAKVLYECELHQGIDKPAEVYAARMQAALGVHVPFEPYLSAVDDGLYCAQYLRALMLEAQLRNVLQHLFGVEWFANSRANEFLVNLWRRGQRDNADELAQELGFGGLHAESEYLKGFVCRVF